MTRHNNNSTAAQTELVTCVIETAAVIILLIIFSSSSPFLSLPFTDRNYYTFHEVMTQLKQHCGREEEEEKE